MTLGHALQWREPLWLLLGLYPLLVLAIAYGLRRWHRGHYADTALLPWALSQHSSQRRHFRLRLLAHLVAWCCFAIAMAGPRFAEKIYQPDRSHYAQVMIVLDLSQSMAAKDTLPNRLQRAHLELLDFLQADKPMRIGLTVFAARPHLLSPLTYDKSVIRHYLAALKPALLPTAGSDINAALSFAAKQFSPSTTASRAILLVSDGDSADAIKPVLLQHTAAQLRQQGIHVYALGVGTLAGQAVVARLGTTRSRVQTTVTTLQRSTLQQYARLTQGGYTDISDDNSDWQQLYADGLATLPAYEASQQASKQKTIWHELYHLPLALGLIFFIAGLIKTDKSRLVRPTIIPLALLMFAGVIALSVQPVAAATTTYAQAYQLYQKGDYKKAGQLFAQLAGFKARLGEADALYRSKDFAQARNVYIQAVLAAGTDPQRAQALFNLANTYYQLKEFIQAEQLYADVLRYQSHYPAAQINRQHARQQQRKKEAAEALTYRPGSGPRSARAANGLDVTNTRVSIGNSIPNTESTLPALNNETPSSVPLLEQTELASQQVENDTDNDWTYRLDSVAAVRTQQLHLQTDATYVWQRLFEQEEGFPAPVSLPHPLVGVSPW